MSVSQETINKRLEELRKNMKGVKRVVIKITYDLQKGQLKVEHSPKKRFDANLVIGMLVIAMQWLSADFYKRGIMKVPQIIRPKKQKADYIA